MIPRTFPILLSPIIKDLIVVWYRKLKGENALLPIWCGSLRLSIHSELKRGFHVKIISLKIDT